MARSQSDEQKPKARKTGNRPWLESSPQLYRRREMARANAESRAERGDLGQLERLDELLGPGVGARRERARLNARLADSERAGGKAR